MYSKHIRGNDTVLILDDPLVVNDSEGTSTITEFNLNALNNFEEEIYYTINYVKLMGTAGVNFHSNIRNEMMKTKISYDNESDQIELKITYNLSSNSNATKRCILDEERFISEVIDEMILANNKYIYSIPIIKEIAERTKEEIFFNYINDDAFVVNEQTINTTIKCLSREDGSCIATANRFMYIPEDDSIILCETIESSDLIDHEYVDLRIISGDYAVTIERASLASRSKGKVKYVCLVVRNATITIEPTSDEFTKFDNMELRLPTIEDYLENKSIEDLANTLYDYNNQDKINLYYKVNNFIDVILININAYLL